jgi:hypothetical protein
MDSVAWLKIAFLISYTLSLLILGMPYSDFAVFMVNLFLSRSLQIVLLVMCICALSIGGLGKYRIYC